MVGEAAEKRKKDKRELTTDRSDLLDKITPNNLLCYTVANTSYNTAVD